MEGTTEITVEDELRMLRTGDKRRDRRLVQLIERKCQRPGDSLMQVADSKAEAKAFYRLIESDTIEPEMVALPMRDACVARCSEHRVVLAVQDTTSLDFSSHPATEDLGPLETSARRGLFVHTTVAVSADGVPLGVIDQQVWARDPNERGKAASRKERPIQEKESYRWIQALRAAQAAIGPETTVVTVADREADIFEFFSERRPANSELLVRACRNRRVEQAEEYLWEAVAAAPIAEFFTVDVSRTKNRLPRTAQVSLRWRKVTLCPPTNGVHDPDLKPLTVTAILVQELDCPDGQSPVQWLLLTTLVVEDVDDARRCVRWYSYRWLVERFHYVIKSGCRIESSQLRTAWRLTVLVAICSLVAWRLLWITYTARTDPEAPCTVALTDTEWQVLYRVVHDGQPPPDQPPLLQDAVRWIARLGGFLGRKSDGDPGVKVLWRGLMRLQDITTGFLLASPQNVGKV